MHTWTKPERRWFEWPLLALKVGIVLALPALWLYEDALSQPCLWPYTVHEVMKGIEAPVAFGCILAGAILFGTAVFEWFHHRRKQAAFDFAFAVVAAFSTWVLFSELATKVR